MTTLMRKFMALCLLIGMLAQMFVTTLPAMGAGEEEESLPILHGVVKCKKADENQHFNFKEHNGNHYTGDYSYCGKEVPFSADLTCENGKLILTGVVTLPEPIKQPEPFIMTKEGDRGWVLKIFGSEFEMIFTDIPFDGQNWTIPLSQGVYLDMVWINKEYKSGYKGYGIGKYEVTQAQYQAVMGNNPSWFKGPNLPVERVTWQNAMDFCAKLTEIEKTAGRLPEGYVYSLPFMVQWEYACRAGTTTDLNSGKNLSNKGVCPEMDEVGWYTGNSGDWAHKKTYPVGQKKPNAWGLYDMHGNVSELVLERTSIDKCWECGGSFGSGAVGCVSAAVGGSDYVTEGYSGRGFRLALIPVQFFSNFLNYWPTDVTEDPRVMQSKTITY